ncbi:uncharacterized protein LOC131860405 [Cryptomeria japonica]|uniref:uncharacterized protein LOC131860405 n=1 Tax=Cryptomeria japonica TaxID=3369 RepID=UPI0027D9F2B9|nr:uncharacterized protein LOC131860405 [Cryptomeria japonica]
MKLISWNVRGCNALEKHCLIKDGLEQMKPDLVCFQETKMSLEEAEMLLKGWRSWKGFFASVVGSSGGLGIIWNPILIKVEELINAHSWQLCKIHSFSINYDFFLINIYGPMKTNLQLETWKQVCVILNNLSQELVVLGGNFNAILDLTDKKGGNVGITASQVGFQNYIAKNGLREVKTNKGCFIWSN